MSFSSTALWVPHLFISVSPAHTALSRFSRLFSTLSHSLHEGNLLSTLRRARSLNVSGKLSCDLHATRRRQTAACHVANKSPGWNRWASFSTATSSEPLTKLQAQDLILRLTDVERRALLSALQEFQSEKMKAEFEGQMAGMRWRSRFGRPSKLPGLGDVDPTGSYCPVPDDWLANKCAETVPPPSARDLWQVGIHNAVPFVGFGFLDNFFMILAGEYIEATIGSLVVISTMTAAALGNTISDIMGIGSAWYVERMAIRIGIKAPKLSPIQMDMHVTRRSANLGRVIGVSIGCILGMSPLLFLTKGDGSDTEADMT